MKPQKDKQKARLRLAAFGTAVFAGMVLVKLSQELDLSTQDIGLISAGVGGVLALVVTFYSQKYLNDVADNLSDQDEERYLQAQLISQASNLKLKEAELQAHRVLADKLQALLSQVSSNKMEEMTFSIRDAVLANATEEVLEELYKRYSTESRVEQLSIRIHEVFEASEKRLNHEVGMLRGRSNLNMAIGVFIGTFGALILGFSLLTPDQVAKSYTELLIYMLPRASVVILIELLAYFFLRMYRSTLSEIRYYQNEITNIEMKKTSALLALGSESVESVLLNFCGTDRNSLMKSDQTTLELERLKIESQTFKSTLNTLSGFFAKATK